MENTVYFENNHEDKNMKIIANLVMVVSFEKPKG